LLTTPLAPIAKLISATIPWLVTFRTPYDAAIQHQLTVSENTQNCSQKVLLHMMSEVLTIGPASRDVPESAIAAHPPLQNPTWRPSSQLRMIR
jgi:hypothetical protein